MDTLNSSRPTLLPAPVTTTFCCFMDDGFDIAEKLLHELKYNDIKTVTSFNNDNNDNDYLIFIILLLLLSLETS